MPVVARQFIRFAGVGGIGFAIDGVVLFVLVNGGVNPFVARLVSVPSAGIATWWFNRIWTFRGRGGFTARRELTNYLAVQMTGGLVNYGLYSGILALFGMSMVHTMLAFCAGSIFGFLFNFVGARTLVFR